MELCYNAAEKTFDGDIFGWRRSVNHANNINLSGHKGIQTLTIFSNPEKIAERLYLGVHEEKHPDKFSLLTVVAEYHNNLAQVSHDSFAIIPETFTNLNEFIVSRTEDMIKTLMYKRFYILGEVTERRRIIENNESWIRNKNWGEFSNLKTNNRLDKRITSVGFYDYKGDWYTVYNANNPVSCRIYHEEACGIDGDYVVKYQTTEETKYKITVTNGQMPLGEYLKSGIPA